MFSEHLNECSVLNAIWNYCWTSILFGFQYMLTSYLCFQTSFFISLIYQITVQILHITFIDHVIMISTCIKIHKLAYYMESNFIGIAVNNICDKPFLIRGYISDSWQTVIADFFQYQLNEKTPFGTILFFQ